MVSINPLSMISVGVYEVVYFMTYYWSRIKIVKINIMIIVSQSYQTIECNVHYSDIFIGNEAYSSSTISRHKRFL